jgi:hypothetical protein
MGIMKYVFLILLISFSFWREADFFTVDQLLSSAFIGAVSGIIWELYKFLGPKFENKVGIFFELLCLVLSALFVACLFAYVNYQIGAKSALLALYSGFLVSEICADYGKIKKDKERTQKNNRQ